MGTVKTWNDDRGFGFILPADGGQELFVHINAFPRQTPPPFEGETVFFEAGFGEDGRARAIQAYLETQDRPSKGSRRHSRAGTGFSQGRSQSPRWLGAFILLLMLGAGSYFYFEDEDLKARGAAWFSGLSSRIPEIGGSEPTFPPFWCDGRVYCSEMTSCREAKYFLRNCPGTKMDGDRDGIPCERQWCTGFFAD